MSKNENVNKLKAVPRKNVDVRRDEHNIKKKPPTEFPTPLTPAEFCQQTGLGPDACADIIYDSQTGRVLSVIERPETKKSRGKRENEK